MLIALEGIDGVGKSYAVNNIYSYLSDSNNNVYDYEDKNCSFFRFPTTGGWVGYTQSVYSKIINRFHRHVLHLCNHVTKINEPMFYALLYALDRLESRKKLLYDMKKYKYVLIDRYVDSGVAYAAAKYSSEEASAACREWLYELEYETFKMPKPDLCILLDGDTDVIYDSLEKRNITYNSYFNSNRIDGYQYRSKSAVEDRKKERDYLDRVQDEYKILSASENRKYPWERIDVTEFIRNDKYYTAKIAVKLIKDAYEQHHEKK